MITSKLSVGPDIQFKLEPVREFVSGPKLWFFFLVHSYCHISIHIPKVGTSLVSYHEHTSRRLPSCNRKKNLRPYREERKSDGSVKSNKLSPG